MVPQNAIGWFDVSKDDTGRIKFWYTDTNNNGLYEVYIGSENGRVSVLDTDGRYMFYYLINLKEMDLRYFDTSKVTDVHSMFCDSRNQKTIDLRKIDFSKVTNFQYMFN